MHNRRRNARPRKIAQLDIFGGEEPLPLFSPAPPVRAKLHFVNDHIWPAEIREGQRVSDAFLDRLGPLLRDHLAYDATWELRATPATDEQRRLLYEALGVQSPDFIMLASRLDRWFSELTVEDARTNAAVLMAGMGLGLTLQQACAASMYAQVFDIEGPEWRLYVDAPIVVEVNLAGETHGVVWDESGAATVQRFLESSAQ